MNSSDLDNNLSDCLKLKKIVKDKNLITKLSKNEMLNLETTCLKRINSSFRCQCALSKNHFPILVSSDNNSITMTNCGTSLDKISDKQHPSIILTKEEIEEQISCIVFNLKRSKIKHVDCPENGQNICFSEESKTISLIDFDSAVIDGKTKNKMIGVWSDKYGKKSWEYSQNYEIKLTETILNKSKKEAIKNKMGLFTSIFGETGDPKSNAKKQETTRKRTVKSQSYQKNGHASAASTNSTIPEPNNGEVADEPINSDNKSVQGGRQGSKQGKSKKSKYSFMNPQSMDEMNSENKKLSVTRNA